MRISKASYEFGGRPNVPPEVRLRFPKIIQLIESMWLGDFHLRPTAKEVAATLRSLAPIVMNRSKEEFVASTGHLLSESDLLDAQKRHQNSSDRHALFLCHHKAACATEARFVGDRYESLLDVACFIGKRPSAIRTFHALHSNSLCFFPMITDSANLQDLRGLVDHVKASDVVILFQSKEVLSRPRQVY